MPQDYCYHIAPHLPIRVTAGGTAHAMAELVGPLWIVWEPDYAGDAALVQAIGFPKSASQLAVGVTPDTVYSFDGSMHEWLIVAFKYSTDGRHYSGAEDLFFLPESNWTEIDTILGTVFSTGNTYKWTILCKVSGTQVIPYMRVYATLPLAAEGDLLYEHSIGYPGDPAFPEKPTRLPIQRAGATTPVRGQLLHTIPDPDNPSQATNPYYDPAWTEFGDPSADHITHDPLLRWNHSGDPEPFWASAAGQIVLAPSDPASPSDYLPQFGAPSSIGLVQRGPGMPPPAPDEGDLLYYSASAGAWVDLAIGSPSDILGTLGTDPAWFAPSALGILAFGAGTLGEGDIPVYEDGKWTLIDAGAGGDGDTLTLAGSPLDPGWHPIAYALSKLATTAGDILYNDGTTVTRLPIGADGDVLTAEGTSGLKWDTLGYSFGKMIGATGAGPLYWNGTTVITPGPP